MLKEEKLANIANRSSSSTNNCFQLSNLVTIIDSRRVILAGALACTALVSPYSMQYVSAADPPSQIASSAAKNPETATTATSATTATTGQKTGFSQDEKVVPVSTKNNSINQSTAKAVNRIAGVKLNAKNLETPPEELPITGFHPIKKLLAPIVRLERNSVQLQQQIMKLEGPIAALSPPMLGLQKRMTSVESKMGSMQTNLSSMNTSVIGVSDQMIGVRGDIKGMRNQIMQLQAPIEALRPPIEKLQKPLVEVAEPLKQVHRELAEMKVLLASVLGAIILATLAISIGTPFAAILVYRNRKKIFPGMSDQELVPKDKDKEDRPLSKVS